MARRLLWTALIVIVTGGGLVRAAGAAPGPFSGWHVDTSVEGGRPNVVTLRFDSPLLRRRVTNTVFLPAGYGEASAPWPVVYFLHGTVIAAMQHSPSQQAFAADFMGSQLARAGGRRQTALFGFEEAAGRAGYVVVALDTDPTASWCEHCVWIDGRDDLVPNPDGVSAPVLPAESHLYGEVIPVVESRFRVRTDRAGRAVMGYSAGGTAALLQAFRHPDRFTAVVAVSPGAEILDDPYVQGIVLSVGYLRDQGYGIPATQEIWYRNFNPPELAANGAGTGMTVIQTSGDGCVPPGSADSAPCRAYPPATNFGAAQLEAGLRRNNDYGSELFSRAGLAHTHLRLTGVHGANNHDAYQGELVDRLNEVFSHPAPEPEAVSYRTVDRRFSVWGYDVALERPNDEFAALLGARRDGRSFTLAGSGTAHVVTPAAFDAGAEVVAVVTGEDGHSRTGTIRAGRDGRVPLTINLGPVRQLDERRFPGGAVAEPVTSIRLEG